jgi:hypothetical protein
MPRFCAQDKRATLMRFERFAVFAAFDAFDVKHPHSSHACGSNAAQLLRGCAMHPPTPSSQDALGDVGGC